MGLTSAVKNKCTKTQTNFKNAGKVLKASELEQSKASSKTEPLSGITEFIRTTDKGTSSFRLYTEDVVITIYTKENSEDIPEEFQDHSFDVSIDKDGKQWIWFKQE